VPNGKPFYVLVTNASGDTDEFDGFNENGPY